ncbi:alpha-1,2-fucosyltransferase [Butyrivibrio proteoclasticus]|uniref:alpha-1,2-fucosyltransferase n=1 Tax=Butyrivibrio proteoclasticus TaxID=43305 RepID=UPI00047D7EA0|nr:alpha-1,2-fucosyltransferase [Butyrivibrio proteoclasticus]
MIHLIFHGGLGNQLFQYAFGRMLQEKYGEQVIYNFNSNIAGEKRKLNIEKFQINKGWSRYSEEKDLWEKHKVQKYLSKTIQKIGRMLDANDSSEEYGLPYKIESTILNHIGVYTHYLHRYPEIKNSWTRRIIVDGLWNDPKYFLDMQSTISKEIILKEHLDEKNQRIMDSIINSNSVCVHVRRGDYVYVPGYLVCTPYYYEKSMKQLINDEDNPSFFVFSDDFSWCKQNIRWPKNTIFVDMNNPDYIDFALMSSCKNFIISNSTFSWWAAFLGSYHKKKVYMPDKWYNDGKTKESMMLPEWIKIRTE